MSADGTRPGGHARGRWAGFSTDDLDRIADALGDRMGLIQRDDAYAEARAVGLVEQEVEALRLLRVEVAAARGPAPLYPRVVARLWTDHARRCDGQDVPAPKRTP